MRKIGPLVTKLLPLNYSQLPFIWLYWRASFCYPLQSTTSGDGDGRTQKAKTMFKNLKKINPFSKKDKESLPNNGDLGGSLQNYECQETTSGEHSHAVSTKGR